MAGYGPWSYEETPFYLDRRAISWLLENPSKSKW
jgi:hypothetical protein